MLGGKFMQHWTIEQRTGHIDVPDDWDNLSAFVKWYLGNRSPLMVPWDAEVIHLDDATSIVLFKKGCYQVELYLIHPGRTIPLHSHPGTEVVTMVLGGSGVCGPAHPIFNTGIDSGRCHFTADGESHGGAQRTENVNGFALLTFERWIDKEPTSAALNWEGDTAGPVHDALLAERRSRTIAA